MKGRFFPLFATISFLALSVSVPAQRGRGGGGSSGGHSVGSSGGRSGGGFSGRSGGYEGRSSGGSSRSGGYSGSSRGYDGRSSGYSSGGYAGSHQSPFDRQTGRSYGGGSYRSGYGGYGSRPGRTGSGGYSNGYGHEGPSHYGGGFNHSALGVQIDRNRSRAGFGGGFAFGGFYGGLRYGYVGYGGYGGYGAAFDFPFYAYDPYAAAVVTSPWYPYSYLPPYVDPSHVTIVNGYDPAYDGGADWRDYDFRSDDRRSRDDRLDDTLDLIQDAFERNSDRDAKRLLPLDGQVAIFNGGKYDYSLGADDFKDMYLDGIDQSKTLRYEIVESHVRGDEVHIRARHEFTDSFGDDQTVYHTYTLRREGGRYVIREFGSE